MKKLIKFAVILAVIAIFAFSSNSYVVKTRTYVTEKGKAIFDKGVDKIKSSSNETVSKIGNEIQ